MEKVCYVIGAGFSRPLGLPLMGDFLSKAKDMWISDKVKYEYFEEIFSMFDSFAKIHNYLHTDQLNIEELLSLAEMQDYVGDTNKSAIVQRFIADVIKYYTPEFVPPNNGEWIDYIAFAAVILGNEINREYEYSIVSMNYDTVIEDSAKYLKNTRLNSKIYNQVFYDLDKNRLAKLHGCVVSGNIIPPTWNKNKKDEVLSTWKMAYKSLSDANHIRILGYSLPESDSYIKYLLKVAILKSQHLKTIDVVCLDGDSKTKKRYDDLIKFGGYRFKDMDVRNYLKRFYSNAQYVGKEQVPYIDEVFDANKYWSSLD